MSEMPAIAVSQPTLMQQADRVRGQARSYRRVACPRLRWVSRHWCSRQIAFAGKRAPTEGGLPAIAVSQPTSMQQADRIRGQARSYRRWLARVAVSQPTTMQ